MVRELLDASLVILRAIMSRKEFGNRAPLGRLCSPLMLQRYMSWQQADLPGYPIRSTSDDIARAILGNYGNLTPDTTELPTWETVRKSFRFISTDCLGRVHASLDDHGLLLPYVGGVEQHVCHLSRELAARNHEVAVATLNDKFAPWSTMEMSVYRIRTSMQRMKGISRTRTHGSLSRS
jgi:hypothetical protein